MNEMDTRFANQFNIQWFPGHMTKTLRMMEQEIQHVDASLVLLDARIPLSITCGVSGAIQFTSCMTGSECIVAINNDPEAQIFNVAHYCIGEDLYKVVPYLTELVKEKKGDE